MSYIYKITNTINNKQYVGKTEQSDPQKRWKEHLRDYKKIFKNKRPLYSAMIKYGPENFKFEILEETNEPNEREIFYITFLDTYSNGYNATLGGDGRSSITNQNEIVKYYLNNKPTIVELAKVFTIDNKTARKILKSHNIKHTPDKCFNSIPVIQKTTTGVVIAKFASSSEAARSLGNINYNGNINRCCLGKRKTANGFKWEFCGDERI